jgi:hypothetical protein
MKYRCASCSVPVLFTSSSLLAKDQYTGKIGPWNPTPQQLIDGSVDNDLPITRLAEMFNVNNFIVSQVNPHVVPFLLKEEEFVTADAQDAHAPNRFRWLQTVTDLTRDEALFRMHSLAEWGIFPTTLTKLASVMSQKYSGDINIYPEVTYANFSNMLANPTLDFMERAALCGERATWPKLSRIRNHMALELAMDDAVHKLRTRVVFSPSQVNLRLNMLNAQGAGRGRGRGFGKHRRIIRSNDPILLRDRDELFSSRSTTLHMKSNSMGSPIQAMPTIPGSPDSAPLLEMVNMVRDEVLSLNPRENPVIAGPSGYNSTRYGAESADPANARSRPRSDSGLRPPTAERADESDSTMSSPALSIKMPAHSSRVPRPSSPERRYRSLFREGTFINHTSPIVRDFAHNGRSDRDPDVLAEPSSTTGMTTPNMSSPTLLRSVAAGFFGETRH